MTITTSELHAAVDAIRRKVGPESLLIVNLNVTEPGRGGERKEKFSTYDGSSWRDGNTLAEVVAAVPDARQAFEERLRAARRAVAELERQQAELERQAASGEAKERSA